MVVWEEQQEQAYKTSKHALCAAKVLVHYNPQLPLTVACDASPRGKGAVLSHTYPDGSERPIAYASRKLASAEKNYAQLNKEALAVIFGVRKFHSYLRQVVCHFDRSQTVARSVGGEQGSTPSWLEPHDTLGVAVADI